MRFAACIFVSALFVLLDAHADAPSHGDASPSGGWIVRVPAGPISVRPDDPIAITVTPGKDPSLNAHVVSFGLVEQVRRFPLASEDVFICEKSDDMPNAGCNASLDIHAAKTVWLRPRTRWPSAGHFVGPIVLASSVRPEGDSQVLDLYLTTPLQQFWGALAIGLGVAIAWVVSQWGRARFTRAQLLLPAAFSFEKMQRVSDAVAHVPQVIPKQSYANISSRVSDLLGQLTESALEQARFVPTPFPSPFGAQSLDVAGYRAFLESTHIWCAVLLRLVEGVRTAADLLSRSPAADLRKNIEAAMGDIDQLAISQLPPAAADVDAALRRMRQLSGPAGGGDAPAIPPSPKAIQLQITQTSAVVWWVVAALTTLVGWYAVVLANLGFGLWTDYVVCVLWGLGFPVGAALLQQTPQSVAQVLKLN